MAIKKRIGDVLLDAGLITLEQLQEALKLQVKTRDRLGDVLISQGYITERQLLEALEIQLGIPRVTVGRQKPEQNILSLIPEALARRHTVLPLSRDGNKLTVAMADPLDYYAIDEMRMATGFAIQPVIAAKDDIRFAIERSYGMQESIEEVIQSASRQQSPPTLEDMVGEDDSPVIRLVNQVILQAVQWRASDIHFDPDIDSVRVRMRVDGVMRSEQTLPKHLQNVIIARLKVTGNLNIAERRLPQDGRFRQTVDGREVDVRVSTLPTIRGEKVVLRIFDLGVGWQRLDQLSFSPHNLTIVKKMLRAPSGMVLATGPTGSGKTSTLYAALSECSTPEVNVMTIEDPVEYQISGVNQVAVNPTTGLTFAAGLRSILRQDPDIVMVGEIRDTETAEIAIRASLTGHLVFSTLHTRGALETITRLVDMGVEPYLVASSVTGVIAQGLVRRICPECRTEYTPTETEREWIETVLAKHKSPNSTMLDNARFLVGRGCASCGHTGYQGRIPVQEVLWVDQGMRHLIVRGTAEPDLRDYADKQGFQTLLYDGLQKAMAGLTSIAEVARVAWRD